MRWGGKKVANQLVKRKINGRASDYLSRARIGDILRESDYITPDNKSYKLPDYAIHIPAEPPRGFDTGYIDKHISQPGYFSNKNGTELAARGSQLKDYYGLDDPNQEITEDMLRYAAENYVKDTKLDNNMGLFFKSITINNKTK